MDLIPTTPIVIIDTRIATGAAKRETFGVFAPLSIAGFLSQAEIDSIQYISLPADTHQKIVRLDVAVEEALGMDVFDPRNGLIGDEEDGLERELSAAVVEQVFERRTEKIVDQYVEFALLSEPAD